MVTDHAITTGHTMFRKPRVIAREVNTRKRKIKEALVIHKIGKDKLLNQDKRREVNSLWLDHVMNTLKVNCTYLAIDD